MNRKHENRIAPPPFRLIAHEASMNPTMGTDSSSQETTIPSSSAEMHPAAAAKTFPTPQRHMAMVQGSGPHYTDEIHELLRLRLRMASTICTLGFTTYYVMSLFQGPVPGGPEIFDRLLHGFVVAVQVVLCTLLWTKLSISHLNLRFIELASV